MVAHIAKARFSFAALVVLCLAGCVAIGPRTVARDRLGYTDAISQSWKRQMLLNMVKIRYADVPIFLDVSSIINQYALETELQGSASWNAFLPMDSQAIGVRGRYSDRPTITYQPVTGEKFTRTLMMPIPPGSIMALIQSGWRADAVFRGCVQSLSGIHNRSGVGLRAHPADPDFYRLMELFNKIQEHRKRESPESAG